MSKKIEQAKVLLDEIKALGIEPKLQGHWVVFDKPLPTELLIRASTLGDEMSQLVGEHA